MKKSILTLFISLLCMGMADAQHIIGFRGGLNFANFGGSDKEEWGGTNSNPNMRVRFHLGGYFEYQFTEVLSFQPGIFYSTKGPSYKGTIEVYNDNTGEFTNETVTYKKNLSYIDMPMLVFYKITPQFSVFGGPQFSFLISAKVKTDASQEALDYLGISEKEDVKDSYKTFDMALPVGVAYMLNNGISFTLSYDIGLTKTAQGYVYDVGGGGSEGSVGVRNNVIKLGVQLPMFRTAPSGMMPAKKYFQKKKDEVYKKN